MGRVYTGNRADGYQSIAPIYDLSTSWALAPLRREMRRLILSAGYGAAGRVLDLACGTGVLMAMLRRRGVRTLGVDLSSAMLTKALRNGLAGSLARADATLLPVRDASVDCVCLVLALHENTRENQDAMLREALRALRPDGRLILADWLTPRGVVAQAAHWCMHPVEWAAGREHYKGFREFLRAGGLEGIIARHGLVLECLDRRFLGALGLAVAKRA
ncbi:methylase involved in ubiquinone/menaquinone biosynthesis [Desulfocurvibacter africanus PCS]|uniref:Methylase involved in ubiquinone/menaquinone biosynthesis n=1 Tax=Desulfocurvibacter africanus PCS TaxID=1262666 RepID=M5PTL4_DESAF|nr:class I SAM-dependent methyltransferase [Desulfocurvibacter africanus]EMG37380.1 methylase involved in ubiquinone/menaquinone biosynthesis [Desulfocurvibacter africanus PCS]